MLVRRAFRLLVSLLGVAAVLRCGAGVSEDPFDRPATSTGNLKGAGAACQSSAECATSVCLPDVDNTRRCCAADCRAMGRACSVTGECICNGDAREVGGRCLLVEGQRCRDANDCASGQCADGVCCDSACDGVCERCDAPRQAGICVLDGEDTACIGRTGYECSARKRCRLPLGFTCELDENCDSDRCEPGEGQSVCCEQACDGVCQRCSSSGTCDLFPAVDSRCPPVDSCEPSTRCKTFARPAANACASNGQCAGCTSTDMAARTPCGVGSQCDGAGVCVATGVGRVAAGVLHTCAIRDKGNVICWGNNSAGQLGARFDLPVVGDVTSPSAVTGLELDFGEDVEQLSAGLGHTCALFANGNVRCWGRVVDDPVFGTVAGLLGTDTVVLDASGFVDPLRTRDVNLAERAVQISAAAYGAHTCALLESGKISCWGFNRDGQCGVDSVSEVVAVPDRALPFVLLPPQAKALEVRAAAGHTCALLEGGGVTCWGEGSGGRLGYGDTTLRRLPQGEVPLPGRAISIATGNSHTCAILEDRSVRCWGANNDGQLGYGHAEAIGDDETPLEAEALPGPRQDAPLGGPVPAGGGGGAVQLVGIVDMRATCALFTSGSVRCWGQNNRGQLGYGHTETLGTRFTPDQLRLRPAGARLNAGGDLDFGGSVRALADNGRCALLVSGELYCWGRNEDAELGIPAGYPTASETLLPSELGPVSWEPPAAMSIAPTADEEASSL